MQSRNFMCRPSVYRLAKSATPQVGRNMSSIFAPTPYYPRYPSGGEFAPLLRLMDEFTSPRALENLSTPFFNRPSHPAPHQVYQPRFDVKEAENSYELRGELPGVEAKDLEVSFSDEKTLTIRGHTEREACSGSSQNSAVTAAPEQQAIENTEAAHDNEDAASDFSSSSYQQATVEDEDAATTTKGEPTPATEAPAESSSAPAAHAAAEEARQEEPKSRYWVSERSIGEFQRTFSFPARVDQEGVTASLKNGILNLVIPKAAAPAARRIAIQ